MRTAGTALLEIGSRHGRGKAALGVRVVPPWAVSRWGRHEALSHGRDSPRVTRRYQLRRGQVTAEQDAKALWKCQKPILPFERRFPDPRSAAVPLRARPEQQRTRPAAPQRTAEHRTRGAALPPPGGTALPPAALPQPARCSWAAGEAQFGHAAVLRAVTLTETRVSPLLREKRAGWLPFSAGCSPQTPVCLRSAAAHLYEPCSSSTQPSPPAPRLCAGTNSPRYCQGDDFSTCSFGRSMQPAPTSCALPGWPQVRPSKGKRVRVQPDRWPPWERGAPTCCLCGSRASPRGAGLPAGALCPPARTAGCCWHRLQGMEWWSLLKVTHGLSMATLLPVADKSRMDQMSSNRSALKMR